VRSDRNSYTFLLISTGTWKEWASIIQYRRASGPALFVSGIPLFVCGLQFRQQVGASLVLVHALAWVLPPLLHARQQTHDQNSEHEIPVEFC
jgi:hypothetical protein